MSKTTQLSKSVKKSRWKKYDEFVTIILLHDKPIIKTRSQSAANLITIKNIVLIEEQIKAINRRFSNYEIIICTGYFSSTINIHIKNKYKHHNIRIIENKEFETCNSCESVRLCLQNTNNDKVFIINGQILFDYKIFNNLNLDEAFAISCACENGCLDIGLNIDRNKKIEYFCYGANQYWSEILYLDNGGVIRDLEKLLINSLFKKKFLFEAINEIIDRHSILLKKSKSGRVVKIQNIKTLELIGKKI